MCLGNNSSYSLFYETEAGNLSDNFSRSILQIGFCSTATLTSDLHPAQHLLIRSSLSRPTQTPPKWLNIQKYSKRGRGEVKGRMEFSHLRESRLVTVLHTSTMEFFYLSQAFVQIQSTGVMIELILSVINIHTYLASLFAYLDWFSERYFQPK